MEILRDLLKLSIQKNLQPVDDRFLWYHIRIDRRKDQLFHYGTEFYQSILVLFLYNINRYWHLIYKLVEKLFKFLWIYWRNVSLEFTDLLIDLALALMNISWLNLCLLYLWHISYTINSVFIFDNSSLHTEKLMLLNLYAWFHLKLEAKLNFWFKIQFDVVLDGN